MVAADLNGDGRIDLYVANDMCPNFVFLNRGDGTFDDVTEISGAGYDAHGQTRAGMGVDAEDVDGDGLPDLLVTNLSNEPNSLYRNMGAGLFEDRTPTSGMATDSRPWVGWGCAWRISTTTAGRIASSPTAMWTTTSSSWAKTVRMLSLPYYTATWKEVDFGWRPATLVPTSTPTTSGGEPRSAISTTTATSISWSITRMAPRLCFATTRKPPITGFACPWSAHSAIATLWEHW